MEMRFGGILHGKKSTATAGAVGIIARNKRAVTRIRRLENQVADLKKLRTERIATIRHLHRDIEEQKERVCRYAEEAMVANERCFPIRLKVDRSIEPGTVLFLDKHGKVLSRIINVGSGPS